MKSALTMLALALAALPLVAEEPPKTENATTTTTAAATTSTAVVDSPLVAAAKRANRLGKKPSNVITNETVSKSRGHVTVTSNTNLKPVRLPAKIEPTAEMKAAAAKEQQRKRDEARAEAKRKSQEKEKARKAAASERYEEGMYDDVDTDAGDPNEIPQKPPQF